VQTKTQRRRFGIWWASKSDKNPIYMWDGKFKVNVSSSSLFGTFVDTQLKLPSGNIPFFDFGNDQILNIYIPKLYKKGKYNLNLTTQDITSQSNIKALYKMGIDFLNSPEIANSGKVKKFAVTYQKDYNNIEVIYFGELYKKTNSNYLKRTLYNSGVNFVISYAWTEGPRAITTTETDIFENTKTIILGTDYSFAGKFSIEPADDFFRDYTHFDLDIYAVARRGNTWKGSRMIKKEK